ncbi:hypothetical protein OUZ56_025525 [Daphnia magna]|uniref:Uncharacterized protein n=1 Tax=Daphnia magna TaxID=35525 RepID=A0ABQ9ZK42_9CRUS|nr:hypothetical protein OUZ56_025525 [Daphnia magna]
MYRTISSTTALPLRSPRRSIEALGSEALGVSPSPLVSMGAAIPCGSNRLAVLLANPTRDSSTPQPPFLRGLRQGNVLQETSFEVDGQQVEELNGI